MIKDINLHLYVFSNNKRNSLLKNVFTTKRFINLRQYELTIKVM
jgi:hypothetical protein